MKCIFHASFSDGPDGRPCRFHPIDAEVGGEILPRIATIESDERLAGRVQAVFPIAF